MTAESVGGGTPMTVAGIECPSCQVEFGPVVDGREASYLAGVHNDLHHPGAGDEARAQVVTAAELGWAAEPAVLVDAIDQAVPFVGDTTASDRAWAARVDTAVQGMDVADQAGMDAWIEAHATSTMPHLAEAQLVAAWESYIRDLYANDTTAPAAGGSAGQVAEAAPELADEDGGWEL